MLLSILFNINIFSSRQRSHFILSFIAHIHLHHCSSVCISWPSSIFISNHTIYMFFRHSGVSFSLSLSLSHTQTHSVSSSRIVYKYYAISTTATSVSSSYFACVSMKSVHNMCVRSISSSFKQLQLYLSSSSSYFRCLLSYCTIIRIQGE